MSTTVKLIVGLVAGSIIFCLLAGISSLILLRSAGSMVTSLVKTEPGTAVRVGSEIAEYDLPEGFPEVFSAQLAGCEMVGYTGSDGHSHIYFFQLPAGVTLDAADMESELKKTFSASTDSYSRTRVVATQPGTMAGQEVTLITSEGTNHDGETFREVSAAFQGNGGQALVVFSRPTASWDQAEADQFLASIR